jgi:ABC-type tungstate transport system substrate-binding protein
MAYFPQALLNAVQLIAQLDPKVYGIVWISLKISCIATVMAGFFGLALGALGILATASNFTGKGCSAS